MKRMISVLAVLGGMAVLTGCAARSTIVLVPDPDGRVGQAMVANEGGEQALNAANQSVQVKDRKAAPGKVKTLTAEEIRAIFSDALAASPPPPVTFILYFLEDSNELTDESKAVFPRIRQTIQERGPSDIVVSGHTDKAGEKEYNYKLALGRAQAVSEMLAADGVAAADITVTSHGEGNPLVQTADGVAEPKNRRVEVVIR